MKEENRLSKEIIDAVIGILKKIADFKNVVKYFENEINLKGEQI